MKTHTGVIKSVHQVLIALLCVRGRLPTITHFAFFLSDEFVLESGECIGRLVQVHKRIWSKMLLLPKYFLRP